MNDHHLPTSSAWLGIIGWCSTAYNYAAGDMAPLGVAATVLTIVWTVVQLVKHFRAAPSE
jgi:hypothetical protein